MGPGDAERARLPSVSEAAKDTVPLALRNGRAAARDRGREGTACSSPSRFEVLLCEAKQKRGKRFVVEREAAQPM